jgi:hypothetical protein
MTSALVSKKTAMKTGLPHQANPDGVVVINPGASAVYQIDTTTDDNMAVQFSGATGGQNVSYATLYGLAKTAFPTHFP